MSLYNELKRRNVLRVAILYVAVSWILLQVGDILFDAFELPPWSMRLLVTILLLGLPVALALSWVFQLTPRGLQRESDVEESDSPPPSSRLNAAIATVVAIALVVFVSVQLIFRDATDVKFAAPPNSIAVLPFTNMSDEPENIYFSDGLSEELLNLLAGINDLRVTARTSSFAYRGQNVDVRSIGRNLNVAHVLEGSVRKSGEQLRITAQLIDAKDGYHIWSRTFDRTLDDVFAMQDEIAAAVVGALRITMLDEEPHAIQTSPDAFSAYLHGVHHYNRRTGQAYLDAIAYLQEAVRLDPSYAPAWVALSSAYSNAALAASMDYEEAHRLALAASERALDIAPEFANANSSRAWLAMTYEADYESSARFFRRALQLSPNNPVILGNSGVLARTIGRLDLAIEFSEQGILLNPISSTAYTNLADQLYRAGRPGDAVAAAEKALALAPGNTIARANLALAYVLSERPREAIEVADANDWPFQRLFIRSVAYHILGDAGQSDAALASLESEFADTGAFYIAMAHAWRGADDLAFEWLQRAIDGKQRTLGIRTDPFLSSLHDDPRWETLLAGIGLADSQVAHIEIWR